MAADRIPSSARSRSANRRFWRFAAVLVSLGIGYSTWLLAGWGGATGFAIAADLALVFASLIIIPLAILAARVNPAARATWRLLVAAMTSVLVGNAGYAVLDLIVRRHYTFPEWTDGVQLFAYGFALVAFFLFPSARDLRKSRLVTLLDVGLLAVALLAISAPTILGVLFSGVARGRTTILSLVFPTGDILLLAVALNLLTRAPRGARASIVLTCVGLALIATADSLLAMFTATGETSLGLYFGWSGFAGYLVVAAGTLRAWTHPLRDLDAPAVGRSMRGLIPFAPIALAVIVAVSAAHPTGLVPVVVFAAVLILVILAVVRQTLTVHDLSRALTALEYQSNHDSLTELPNRSLFVARVARALCVAPPDRQPAVLFFDLDDFKNLNDVDGHGRGDDLLVQLADRLRGTIRDGDLVARLGGDEFGVLLHSVENPGAAMAIADRVLGTVENVSDSAAGTIHASAGVAVAQGDETAEEMLRRADVAMYAAKRRGKASAELFDPRMDAPVDAGWRSELERAVTSGEFVLFYQPIVDLATSRVSSFEALIRWQHPERGLLFPDAFIRDLEETDLIVLAGAWVAEAACRQLAVWREATGRPLTMHINASHRQIRRPSFPDVIRSAIVGAELPGAAVTVELTESDMVRDSRLVASRLHAIRELGVHVALDDFGTGYSSLAHLREFPVDVVKIDKSFIDDVAITSPRPVLASALIQIATSFGHQTVAEGAETAEQVVALRRMGCTSVQGYYFARPLPADQILPWIDDHQRRHQVA